ncbi:MAG: hypothetical protein QOI76_935 [Frankiales bacterium]|nr:hypothetical protein [Frankiales bacterium]
MSSMTEDVPWPSTDGPDYGRTVELDFFLDPAADEPAAVLDTARLDTLSLTADNDERTLTTFIHEVAPAVRHRVAEVRAAR